MDVPPQDTVAKRFGALVTQLATRAGYDLTPGAGGRAQLADEIGMSRSSVGRMLDGKTLPMPSQFEPIAKAVGSEVRELMVEAGVISAAAWPKDIIPDVRSATSRSRPLTPDAAADAWGITDPMIRGMLLSNIEQAIRLQREQHKPDAASTGGA